MSAFGNDCHFYYNASCLKGNSCPFRHCEAAKANDVTCTYWKQKTCTKPNCPFRHSEGVLQANQNKNRAEIPCYWETQPTGCTKAVCPFKHMNPKSDINTSVEAQATGTETESPSDVKVVEVHVQPVVVNLEEDSDVEPKSPVKTINKHRIAVPNKPAKLQTTNLSSGSQQRVSQSVPKQVVKLAVNKPNIKSRLTNQMPEPESRKSVKDRLKLGVSDTSQQNSLKARLGVSKPGIKNRLGITKQQTDPVEYTSNDSGEDSDLEVKSLEQIQREKALRSMGLIELKGGKIMKIADWEKEQRGHNERRNTDEESEDLEEDKEDSEEEEDEEVSEEEDEDDLEEPEEIELFAPDEPEEDEDTRTFISTGNEKVSSIPTSQNKKLPQHEGGRKGKRMVIEDRPVDDKTPDLKASLKRRLGGRVAEVTKDLDQSGCEQPVKKRLTMPIGSSNQGTIKTISGIKSRLGIVGDEPALLDARQKLKLKKKDNLEPIIMSVSMGSDEEDSNDSKGMLRKTALVRKRGWRKTAKDTDAGSDKDSSRPATPNQSLSARSSPEKSTETEEVVSVVKRQRKEEDAGTKLQNMMTQKWRNNIWSNRTGQKSKPVGETLDSLGIGIIDIKGGKVVKMGKNKDEEKTKMKSEDKLLDQIEKLSRVSKKEIRERKVYVPPGRQRAGISDPDAGKKRVSTDYTKKDALSDEDSGDMQVKTFSEIMAAKRQRQKKLAVENLPESSSKKSSEDLELPQEITEDSNEAPADVLKMAQMITGSLASPVKLEESHHHRSKKKSKWRKKSKTSKEKKSSKENKLSDNEEESTQDTLKSCDTAISEDSKNETVESVQHSVETVDPVLLKAKRQNSENGGSVSDKDILSPDKNRSEHLLSDSWLDLVEDTEGGTVTQDDDDLLREIDELLA